MAVKMLELRKRSKTADAGKSKASDALAKSPINYFSDLFIAVMVVGWVAVLCIMTVFAIYSNVALGATDVWSTVAELVTIPLSAGGAIWMVKNSVQHAIANNRGQECPYDFPAVDAMDEICGQEQPLDVGGADESEDE